jgi:hypothetical protein
MVLWTENITTPEFEAMLKSRIAELEKLESVELAEISKIGSNGNGGPNECHQTRQWGPVPET